ncbi:hypothetical protein PILCRDRAFT_812052 [Piloderma croceum F 1598]|uniref:Uncharacterized protein n=1 Tax=Piloderma croceum (strain F 1598) TaxID=765440 RepID=A0A0C3G1W1_PILCF|nr:hypothetical protein PILCRDRAFT_812052 [Piloderma croceum F 1598]
MIFVTVSCYIHYGTNNYLSLHLDRLKQRVTESRHNEITSQLDIERRGHLSPINLVIYRLNRCELLCLDLNQSYFDWGS